MEVVTSESFYQQLIIKTTAKPIPNDCVINLINRNK